MLTNKQQQPRSSTWSCFLGMSAGKGLRRQDAADNLVFLTCWIVIDFSAWFCIGWLKVSLRLVFELCHPSVAMEMIHFELYHPSVAMETIQDGQRKNTLKANIIKSIVLTADLLAAFCYISSLHSFWLWGMWLYVLIDFIWNFFQNASGNPAKFPNTFWRKNHIKSVSRYNHMPHGWGGLLAPK